MEIRTLALHFIDRALKFPEIAVQYSKDQAGVFQPTSYARLYADVKAFAAGLKELGLVRGDHVGIISDNRKEWLVSDLAIMGLGAADVPRGCDATEQEIRYILSFSDCRIAIAENSKQLKKLLDSAKEIPMLKDVIVFDPPEPGDREEGKKAGIRVLHFPEAVALGAERLKKNPDEYLAEAEKGMGEDLATIIYTSGTTGEPKGVMLSHRNFLFQVFSLPEVIDVYPGHIWLSVLPVWHSFERILQYVAIDTGSALAYSKPVGSIILADLAAIKPQWLSSVPRIWEAVRDGVYRNVRQHGGIKKVLFEFFVAVGGAYAYFKNMILGRLPDFGNRNRVVDAILAAIPLVLLTPFNALGSVLVFKTIKEKLGGKFVAGISGGGALPPAVDKFFGAIGILILEGYGLTETAPVVAVRRQHKPKPGVVGKLLPGTEAKILDEQGKVLAPGKKGLIMVKGGQVMKGYYKRPELTAKVLGSDGWFNTGDLGMLTRHDEIKITGRAKDTIVLLGGENVEPAPIEQKLCESEYIQQVVILGQDKKYLAALIVPKQETVMNWAKENIVPMLDYEGLLVQPELVELIDKEVADLVCAKTGFKTFERVFKFVLLEKPFEVGRELSHKQEVMRHEINKIYEKEIKILFPK